MKKIVLWLVIVLCLGGSAQAEGVGTNHVSIREPVVFRALPDGEALGTVQHEVLIWSGEVRKDDTLWYRVSTKRYGEGYVQAAYALPFYFPIDGPAREDERLEGLSNGLAAYYRAQYRYRITHGFLKKENGRYVHTRDASADTESTRIDMVLMLYRSALIAMDEHYATLTASDMSIHEKDTLAAEILRVHYGMDDPWVIFTADSPILPGIRPEDWHGQVSPTVEDERMLERIRRSVIAELSER